MAPPIVLYVTSDWVLDHNIGFGSGFRALADASHLVHHVVAPLSRLRAEGPEGALRALEVAAQDIRPDLVFAEPLTNLPWTDGYLARLLRRSGSPALVYWDGDGYGGSKQLSSRTFPWLRHADTVFTVSLGAQREMHGRHTRRIPRYVPQVIPGRLVTAAPIPPIREAEYDAMHIGNCYLRFRFREGISGARDRFRVVQGLQRMPGCRLAVHGSGWRGRGALGELPYDEQVRSLRTARFSVGWDHFAGRHGYFSDRFPISMYAGRPHIASRPGPVDWLPGPDQGLHLVDSPAQMVARARELLHTDDDVLDATGRALHAWIRDRLTSRNALLHMLGAHLDLPQPPDDPWAAIAAMNDQCGGPLPRLQGGFRATADRRLP